MRKKARCEIPYLSFTRSFPNFQIYDYYSTLPLKFLSFLFQRLHPNVHVR